MIAKGVFSSCAAAARASRHAAQWCSSLRKSIAGLADAGLAEFIGIGSISLSWGLTTSRFRGGPIRIRSPQAYFRQNRAFRLLRFTNRRSGAGAHTVHTYGGDLMIA